MMQSQPETVLVTGGAGFIGSHLCQMLVNDGIRVINVDNYNNFYNPVIKNNNIKSLLGDSERFVDMRVDITHQEALAKVFAEWGNEIELVVHLAAKAGVRPSLEDPSGYLETNVTGTLNLLEQMRHYDINRLIFASSSSVYGNRTDPPFREDQDISKPISPYAATKAMGETLLHTYSHLYGIQMVLLRFFTVYGPRQRPDLAIHTFTKKIHAGQSITLFGDGKTQRDYTYIEDILQGIRGAMAYTATPFEIFNLGESQPIFLDQLIQLLEDLLGKKAQIQREPLQPGDVQMTCADISKARQWLGYAPQTPIEHGLEKFVKWYR